MSTVVTYQLAYLSHHQVSLCDRCVEAGNHDRGVLGPVLHGAHEGECEGASHGTVSCECGEWSGEACAWFGPVNETVVVEFMPEHLRGSHTAAGGRGSYPHNGARRIRVARSCADCMVEHDSEWVTLR